MYIAVLNLLLNITNFLKFETFIVKKVKIIFFLKFQVTIHNDYFQSKKKSLNSNRHNPEMELNDVLNPPIFKLDDFRFRKMRIADDISAAEELLQELPQHCMSKIESKYE